MRNDIDDQNTEIQIFQDQVQSIRTSQKKDYCFSFIHFSMLILILLVIVLAIASYNNKPISSQLKKYSKAEEIKLKLQLQLANVLMNKLEKSFREYTCLQIQPMFHYFDENNKIMYFQTYYQIVLPSCELQIPKQWSVDRQNIQIWNKDTQVVEWALKNIKENDNILYHRPNVYNFLEMTMLSQLIGPNGSLLITNIFQGKTCMDHIIDLHHLNNIKFNSLAQIKSVDHFNAIIIDSTTLQRNMWKLFSKVHPQTNILIYSKNKDILSKFFKEFRIQKMILQEKMCGELVESNRNDQGFYSITSKRQTRNETIRKYKKPLDNGVLKTVQQQYLKFKNKYMNNLIEKLETIKQYQNNPLCIFRSNRDNTSEQFLRSIYGHKYYKISKQQLNLWQQHRQPIQWIRTRKPILGNLYYQVKNFNLLVIVQIALLLKTNILQIVCTQIQCSRIKFQIKKNKIININLLKQSNKKQALSSSIIISDNEQLIMECIDNNYLKDGYLLGFFTFQRQVSIEVLRRIYVHNRLSKVTMSTKSNYCIGYQYQHYFWNSSQPKGYYQITPSNYVIYSFWDGSPQTLGTRKRFLIQELISTANVEVKILNSIQFKYFQVQDTPIHEALQLLTPIHRSDYFRCYMMHNYGGGYSDIKHMHFDWKPYFQELEKNDNKLAYGYAQKHNFDIGCNQQPGLPSCKEIKLVYNQLIGNCLYLFKKKSSLTKNWFDRVSLSLDTKYEALKLNPPQVSRDCFNCHFQLGNGSIYISKYPFRWAELGGEHLVRSQHKYLNMVATSMPYVINIDYIVKPNTFDSH